MTSADTLELLHRIARQEQRDRSVAHLEGIVDAERAGLAAAKRDLTNSLLAQGDDDAREYLQRQVTIRTHQLEGAAERLALVREEVERGPELVSPREVAALERIQQKAVSAYEKTSRQFIQSLSAASAANAELVAALFAAEDVGVRGSGLPFAYLGWPELMAREDEATRFTATMNEARDAGLV
jgi:hypothetical protein